MFSLFLLLWLHLVTLLDQSFRTKTATVLNAILYHLELLTQLIHQTVPGEGEDEGDLPYDCIKKLGDAGGAVTQFDMVDYRTVLHTFPTPEYHLLHPEEHSLVYYVENLGGTSYDRAKEILSTVVSPSVMLNGGTAHLYMSSPGAAALDNHTDVTDIVVLQLDGAKEWVLCSGKENSKEEAGSPLVSGEFTRKLNSCSTFNIQECRDGLPGM